MIARMDELKVRRPRYLGQVVPTPPPSEKEVQQVARVLESLQTLQTRPAEATESA
jgi:hypothetical protein